MRRDNLKTEGVTQLVVCGWSVSVEFRFVLLYVVSLADGLAIPGLFHNRRSLDVCLQHVTLTAPDQSTGPISREDLGTAWAQVLTKYGAERARLRRVG